MAINLFNSLTQNKDQFQPITPNKVGIYSCGPTVYNYAHIGNLRSYVFADLLKKMFLANGYQVKHVMNITDVDDKTIRDSQASGEDLATFTRRFEDAFFADCTKLNIQKPEATPRATENINQMIALIEKLLEQGCAYKSEDGIYFSIDKSKDYGKIANLEKRTGQISRIKNDEYDKANPQDFALWKFHTEPMALSSGRPLLVTAGRAGISNVQLCRPTLSATILTSTPAE